MTDYEKLMGAIETPRAELARLQAEIDAAILRVFDSADCRVPNTGVDWAVFETAVQDVLRRHNRLTNVVINCTIHLDGPRVCECGSGSNAIGPGHSDWCPRRG